MRKLKFRKAAATACALASSFMVIGAPGVARHAQPHHVVHSAPAGVSWKGAR